MERRYSKEDEALEIKSLRRIISAYLNYSDAADEDVRRYERSYKQLSPAHKAFEPPLDMSQDIDFDQRENIKHLPVDRVYQESSTQFGQNNISTGHPITVWGNASEPETSSFKAVNSVFSHSQNPSVEEEGIHVKNSCKSIMDGPPVAKNHTEHASIQDDAAFTANRACESSFMPNGNASSPPGDWMDPSLQLHVPLVDVDKVRCIIRNIVRDWALEGEKERDQCYKPIIEELNRLFPDRCKERPPCCLVPGAGLGRLALEISCAGFASQGNEFSYYMMICSSFILNHTQIPHEWKICPWIHSNCNSFSDNDQLRPVSFPDIHPASAGITEGFTMCGGDFVEVYGDVSQEASWDAVVTCFFLDTAHNVVEYIEIISKILKENGVWINLGPLLYHFADSYGSNDEMSIELSLEEVKNVAMKYGFELEVDKIIETTYTTNPRSMMQNRYFAAFWTMRKSPRHKIVAPG